MPGRVQLALNVNDVGVAVGFYSKLFGAEPAKVRPGYANFALADPPLKLVLLENPGQGGTLNHLGVEVADTGAVEAEQARLAGAGLTSADERDTTCCYARQDKFWVEGAPDGERWEIYTVLADSPASGSEHASGAQCCGGEGSRPGDATAASGVTSRSPGADPAAAAHALQAPLAHQSLHRAPGHRDALPVQLQPDEVSTEPGAIHNFTPPGMLG